MSLVLHYHPLSSYCWKVQIGLYELGAPFEARVVNLGDPQLRAAFEALWPTAKIPLLEDGEDEFFEELARPDGHMRVRNGALTLVPAAASLPAGAT